MLANAAIRAPKLLAASQREKRPFVHGAARFAASISALRTWLPFGWARSESFARDELVPEMFREEAKRTLKNRQTFTLASQRGGARGVEMPV